MNIFSVAISYCSSQQNKSEVLENNAEQYRRARTIFLLFYCLPKHEPAEGKSNLCVIFLNKNNRPKLCTKLKRMQSRLVPEVSISLCRSETPLQTDLHMRLLVGLLWSVGTGRTTSPLTRIK